MDSASARKLLAEGVGVWNDWRVENPAVTPSLAGEDLSRLDLVGINFSQIDLRRSDLFGSALMNADLSGANLTGALLDTAFISGACFSGATMRSASLNRTEADSADLSRADLRFGSCTAMRMATANLVGADLSDANIYGSDLSGSDFGKAVLRKTNLTACNLSNANFAAADLTGASLVRTVLVGTDVTMARLSGAHVYGISAWDLMGSPTDQQDLVITRRNITGWNFHRPTVEDPLVTVDNLRLAQFVHLLLDNETLREVVDTVTSKVVLILGRFTPERKAVLEAIKGDLRSRNLTPVLFDFAAPSERDLLETVELLARMARFIVADLTDAISVPMELQAIAPHVSVPICSIVHTDQEPFSMFQVLRKYPWVLEPYRYTSSEELIGNLNAAVIEPAEAKRIDLDRD